MLGCSIRASAWRSASKRAITWRVSIPSLMILQGDLAPDGLLLLGHVDAAEAALADELQELVGAHVPPHHVSVAHFRGVAWLERGNAIPPQVFEQRLDLRPDGRFVGAVRVQERGPLPCREIGHLLEYFLRFAA